MRYPISKNINEKSQHLISLLDYYSISKYNIRQLLPMDSPGSQLFNGVFGDETAEPHPSRGVTIFRAYIRTLTGFGNKGLARDEEGLSHAMSWKVSYANDNDMNLYNSSY